MNSVTLEGNLHQANARVVACQQALREQLAHVRELEQWGLDASVARALLRIYEESHATSILDRRRLCGALIEATTNAPLPVQDNDRESVEADDTTYHRQAA